MSRNLQATFLEIKPEVAYERFVKSFLDLFVIQLLGDGPGYGLRLMKNLERETGIHVGPGTFYPLLYDMQEKGLVIGQWNYETRRRRMLYTLTERGTEYHELMFHGIESLMSVLSRRPSV